jgi:methylenetetrahydrofolate reductase (NADPH)
VTSSTRLTPSLTPRPARSRTVRDRLAAGKPTISLEFMPPKTAEDAFKIWQTVRKLESLRPNFVSVTYGAGGST